MDSLNSSTSSSSGGKKELPYWMGDVRFLTLNEKKKLYLGGPEGLFAENKSYLDWLHQEQFNRAKCACCGKNEQELTTKLLRCSRCEITAYCSSDCQRQHWKEGHKKRCKKPNNERFNISFQFGDCENH